jgi:hypothetical protein
MTATVTCVWFADSEEYVPVDPLLREPLDLYGARARKRHLTEAILRRLGLEQIAFLDRASPGTYSLVYDMIDPLRDALATRRIDPSARARTITLSDPLFGRSGLDYGVTFQAVLDLGWTDEMVRGGSVFEVARQVHDIYVQRMTRRVLHMLREFERQDYLEDVSK